MSTIWFAVAIDKTISYSLVRQYWKWLSLIFTIDDYTSDLSYLDYLGLCDTNRTVSIYVTLPNVAKVIEIVVSTFFLLFVWEGGILHAFPSNLTIYNLKKPSFLVDTA